MVTPHQFPQSLTHSTGAGPDFPGSSGDRERGRFRPSRTARLTNVAVVGDDGEPVTKTTDELLTDLLLWHKALVVGLAYQSEGIEFSVEDLLEEAGAI